MPSAMSRAMEPVGMTSIGARTSSPRRMTEPLPNCRSIWASAASRALSRSAAGAMGAVPVEEVRDVFVTCSNLDPAPDTTPVSGPGCGPGAPGPTPVDTTEQVFDQPVRHAGADGTLD